MICGVKIWGHCAHDYANKIWSLWRWYVSTNIMFLNIIHRPVYIIQHNVSETGSCLRLQVKPSQFEPIDWASPYLRTPIPVSRWCIEAKHNTNHLRELRQNIKILKTLHVWGLAPESCQDRNHQWRYEILRMVPTYERQIFPLNIHWTEL
jgi:hypothetical protein